MHVTFATSVYEEEKLNENVRTDMVNTNLIMVRYVAVFASVVRSGNDN